jgi:hypothetical protein
MDLWEMEWGVDQLHQAWDSDQWQAALNSVMDFVFVQKFSRKTLLHGINY